MKASVNSFCVLIAVLLSSANCNSQSVPVLWAGDTETGQRIVNWREIAWHLSEPAWFEGNPFRLTDQQRANIAAKLESVNSDQIREIRANSARRKEAYGDPDLFNEASAISMSRGGTLMRESEVAIKDYFATILNERQLEMVRELAIYYASSTLSFDEIIRNAEKFENLELSSEDLKRLRIKMFEVDQRLKLEIAKMRKQAWKDVLSQLSKDDQNKIEQSLLIDDWKLK